LTAAPRLDAAARANALHRLGSERFDVLVVGGGITGIGVALDAAARGLSVGLVERDDFASGTSSRSTKLIHGGLRYLENRDFRLVREALRERHLLLSRIAPHLVQPVPFLLPLRSPRERAYFGAGVALYDALGGRARAVPRHRHLGRGATRAAAPALRDEATAGAIRYFDAQMDDARYALMLLRTAVAHGVCAASRTRVVGFVGQESVEGVWLEDVESGIEFEARARVTIVAAGVWSRELERLAGIAQPISIRASKGVHIVVPHDRLELQDALIIRTERSVLLVVPWNGHWLIGTTDTPFTTAFDRPTATSADVSYLLERLNAVLRRPLSSTDVTSVFAGLRPLIGGGSTDTVKLSREHIIRRPRPRLLTVAGGKYTTYRVMAADTVDAAAVELGLRVGKSRTDTMPLVGADDLDEARRTLHRSGLPPATRERLLRRYGGLATEVVATAPSSSESLPGAAGYLRAEAAYAVTHEGARRLEDVFARRTRIAIETADAGLAAAAEVAELLRRELGWSAERASEEVAEYRAWVAAERAAQSDPGLCQPTGPSVTLFT